MVSPRNGYSLTPDGIGNWKVLVFVEGGKHENQDKDSRSKDNDAESGPHLLKASALASTLVFNQKNLYCYTRTNGKWIINNV